MIPERDEHEWALARAGDGGAFGRVYDRHLARLRRHALSVAASADDVDDIVAVAFFEAWRRRDDVRFVDGSLLPWLLVTATNAAHNLRRSARRYQSLLLKLPAPTPVDVSDDDDASRALRSLPLADQRILTLSVLLDLTEKEVAQILEIPQGTVKSRLSRSKRRLAAHLSDQSTNARSTHKEAPNGA